MTRPPRHLTDNGEVVRITPNVARTMLIHGLLPSENADQFKPANLTAESIVKLLHQANEVRNRTVSMSHVQKLARDMTARNWLWTGDPIHVDRDGFVRNGQHRLLAVIYSNTTQDFMVIRNLDPATQLVIDVGRTRNAANQMHMAQINNANLATPIANTLIRWRIGKALVSSFIPSVMEIHELIRNEEEIPAAVAYLNQMRRVIRRAPLSALGAAYIEAGHLDVKARDEFFGNLMTGADLAVDDPTLVLRNKIILPSTYSLRSRRGGQLYLIVHAWNTWRQDKTMRLLRVPVTLTSETFPKMA
jgi:hypothetical protein